ncbi:MAG: hypothetical protein ACI9Y1_003264 [Lentisphaeria bacterium]
MVLAPKKSYATEDALSRRRPEVAYLLALNSVALESLLLRCSSPEQVSVNASEA